MTRAWSRLVVLLALGAALPAGALELDARTDWVQRTELATPLATAVVAEVLVRPGDRVASGALLIRLDDRAVRASVEEAEAALEEARRSREEGRRELDRALELYERTVLSQHELQTAEIVAAAADAAYRRAAAALTQARLDREHTRIQAPFDAVVVDVAVRPGEVVVNRLVAVPLVTVARSDRMQATARLEAEQVERIRTGDDVQVAVGGQWRRAVITAVALEPRSGAGGTGTYPMGAEFEVRPEEAWRAGRPATVRLGTSHE
jgi:multidrug efflux system membrane fusion protein